MGHRGAALAAVLSTLLLGCGDNRALTPDAAMTSDAAPDAAVPLAFVDGPTITLAPLAPLTGKLVVSTNRPTRVNVAVTDPNRSFTIDLPELAAEHTLPVLGLRAATVHAVTVTVTDEAGELLTAAPLEVTTDALPADFPAYTIDRLVPAQIEPGLTLLGLRSYVFAIDEDGEVVFYFTTPREPVDLRRLPNGHFLMSYRDMIGAGEIDVFGNEVRSWYPANTSAGLPGSTPVAADSFHHEFGMLPDGDLYALSTEKRTFENYPTSETDPTPLTTPHDAVGDVVLVFHPDGTVVHSWPLFDRLDPYRLGYGSYGSFWSTFYTPIGATDWSHSNAIVPDPSDGGFLVSVRHQDAIVKLNANGDLQWILGTHDNWKPAFTPYLLTPVGSPFAWQFHQHGPKILPNGNIVVFDNGNFRVSPPTEIPSTSYSRAVEYRVDPVAHEVEQVWEFDADQMIFAPATGEVDIGETTGNVIITFGAARRIVEVTHTTPATVVFELESAESLYRSERLPSLYP
jgi:hypothetical protein